MNGELSQKRFAFGVTALTISVIIVKIIGLVYKIPLLHILGAEGMGYFNAAYEIYALFFVMSTAGLPIAVSILVSENLALGKGRNADKVHKVSFALFAVVGVFGALVMGFGASWLAVFWKLRRHRLQSLPFRQPYFWFALPGLCVGCFKAIRI